jgi:hypothetical protein
MTGHLQLQVHAPCWALAPVELGDFLRNIGEIVPEQAVFRLESGGNPAVESFMVGRPAKYPNEGEKRWLAFFKTAAVFYMPSTLRNLEGLADLSENCAEPEFGNALGIYLNDELFLSWHDLPYDPVYVSFVVPEDNISTFCGLVHCDYTRAP